MSPPITVQNISSQSAPTSEQLSSISDALNLRVTPQTPTCATHNTTPSDNFRSGHPQPPASHASELPIKGQRYRMDSRRMEAAASAQSYLGFALCLPITDEFPMAALVHHLLTTALSSQVLSVSQDSAPSSFLSFRIVSQCSGWMSKPYYLSPMVEIPYVKAKNSQKFSKYSELFPKKF